MGTTGHFFELPPAQEGLSSTIFNKPKNVASSSQELRPGAARTSTKRERDMNRESLNTSTQSPHFQSRSGRLNHTGGTYSHGGMMDHPRIPTSEVHLWKFPDSMELQSWNVNFKHGVSTRTADLRITMFWIKEVETAKSIDELVTFRSIVGRNDFSDYDMLDASTRMFTSAKE